MQADEILDLMKRYFAGKLPADAIAAFSEQRPRALLKESLDVVDFLVYLEEELGREIDLQVVGEKALALNFGDLSREMARLLAE